MEGGLVLVPCLVVETKEECCDCEKREREKGRGRKEEDMRFLYVAGDGLVALIMESMHLECSVGREYWGTWLRFSFFVLFLFFYIFFNLKHV